MFIRISIAAFLSVLWFATASSAQPDPAQPETALDFFLGTWRTVGGVPRDDGSYTQSTGILIGERAFRGGTTPNVMVRAMTIPDSQPNDSPFDIRYFEDITIYSYHTESGLWRGVTHNTLANRKWRDVTVSDGAMSFIQSGEQFQTVAPEGQIRFTYNNITDDRFEMRVDYMPPGEREWIEGTYRMTAYRAG
jgi:hypothetical protein